MGCRVANHSKNQSRLGSSATQLCLFYPAHFLLLLSPVHQSPASPIPTANVNFCFPLSLLPILFCLLPYLLSFPACSNPVFSHLISHLLPKPAYMWANHVSSWCWMDERNSCLLLPPGWIRRRWESRSRKKSWSKAAKTNSLLELELRKRKNICFNFIWKYVIKCCFLVIKVKANM